MRLFETQIFSQRDERTESLIRGSRKLIVSVVMLVHTFYLSLLVSVPSSGARLTRHSSRRRFRGRLTLGVRHARAQ